MEHILSSQRISNVKSLIKQFNDKVNKNSEVVKRSEIPLRGKKENKKAKESDSFQKTDSKVFDEQIDNLKVEQDVENSQNDVSKQTFLPNNKNDKELEEVDDKWKETETIGNTNVSEASSVDIEASDLSSSTENLDFYGNESDKDDIFGVNDFSEDFDDNFIIESYNKEGIELIRLNLVKKNVYAFKEKLVEEDDPYQEFNNDESCYENFENFENDKSSFTSEDDEISEVGDTEQPLYENIVDNKNNIDVTVNVNISRSYVNSDNSEENVSVEEILSDSEWSEEDIQEEIIYEYPQNSEFLEQSRTENLENTHTRLETIIDELINSEKNYVSALKALVKRYIPSVYKNFPSELFGKVSLVFGHIKNIHLLAIDVLAYLVENQKSVENIPKVFLNQEYKIRSLYSSYAKTHAYTKTVDFSRFEEIIQKSEGTNQLTNLKNILNKPFARLKVYIFFFQKLQTELSSNSNFNVIDTVLKMVTEVNTECEVLINSNETFGQGPFIMKEEFKIKNKGNMISTVYLYEDIIIITTPSTVNRTPKKSSLFFVSKLQENPKTVDYVDSIQTTHLSIHELETKDKYFYLKDHSVQVIKATKIYYLKAKTKEIKNIWVSKLREILWEQLEGAKGQQREPMSIYCRNK